MIKRFLSLFICLSPLYGFTFGNHDAQTPLEIDASNGIVCEQKIGRCTASGNVVAKQGDKILTADRLTAYTSNDTSSQKLTRLVAEGNVVYISPESNQKALGDVADYDLEKGHLDLRGHHVKVFINDWEIVALDHMSYDDGTQTIYAKGGVTAFDTNNKILKADEIKGYLKSSKEKDLGLHRLDAIGNVKLSSETEFAQSDRGTFYQSPERIVTLQGNVYIDRLDGRIMGDMAEVNLETGISKVTNDQHKRVKVLLIPSKASRDLLPGRSH